MYFLLSKSPDIMGTEDNTRARLGFIQDITGVVPTPWKSIRFHKGGEWFLICNTDDNINGIYVTAHNYEVVHICNEGVAAKTDFFVANTCIYSNNLEMDVLALLRQWNKNIQLWYAKQELELIDGYVLRNTNTITEVGTFGFMTSKSDRLMFKNRKKGFEKALQLSFDRVSGLYRI